MSRFVSAVASFRDKISHQKHELGDTLSSHSEKHRRGGSEDDVAQIIEQEVQWSSDDEEEEQEAERHGGVADQLGHGEAMKSLDDFLDNDDPPEAKRCYGKLPLAQSQDEVVNDDVWPAKWTSLADVDASFIGKEITFAPGSTPVKDGGVSESVVRWVEHMRPGSIVVVGAQVKEPEQRVKSTSVSHVELEIEQVHLLSARTAPVPFSVYDADAATDGHSISDRVRLANRILDLRTPSTQAVFRVQSAVCRTFRRYLEDRGFLEIHTPKLQGGATEGGSDVFKLDYFGRPAFLAQSPQLAKQMCISADFPRVFEIGPVFRAENSNTPRHMTEFTGLDLEMAMDRHYHGAMWLIDATLKEIFTTLYDRNRADIDTLKHHFPHNDPIWLDETPRVTFAEGVKLLNESGWTNDDGSQQSEHEDLPTRAERRLGELVKEKFHTDYYILDKFPAAARPFYTMPDPQDDTFTNSFDFMVRGQEILSGGQRIHEHTLLRERMEAHGMDSDDLKEYLQAFEWVAPPHAGAASPRKKEPNLRHPEDNTLQRPKGYLQPLENLVANYGDATNTSWMDERSQIWRDDKTGAAIAYVPMHDRAIIAGNPLCETKQLEEVITAFLKWLRREPRLRPLFILVDKEAEEVLGDKLGWKSFTNVAEQRVNLANNEHLTISSDVDRKIRHASSEGVKVTDYGSDAPEDIRRQVEQRIKEWQDNREGAQVHLSVITPFKDALHRQYFIATDDQGKMHSLVVLAQLAPRWGVQVKWALDFPGATNGAIELTVQAALKAAAKAGYKTCTFGAGATAKLSSEHNVGGAKAATLDSLCQTLAAKFSLDKKTGFRTKFNTLDDPLFLCYPPRALGPKGARAIIDFFQGEE